MTAGLRPVFALFVRALRDDLRSPFPPILRSAALLLVLGLLWMNQATYAALQSAAGLYLLRTLATLNFAGITILGLATFASAITEEKEDGTLALLRMTRLNPLAILLGKSTARLASGLLFLAVQIPFTLLCVTLGGVTSMQVVTIYAILAGYLFFLCNLGLLFSVLYRGTGRAVVATVTVCFFIFLLAPFLESSGDGETNFLVRAFAEFFASVNPVTDYGQAINRGALVFESRSLAFLLTTGAGCFLAAWVLFERFCGGELAEVPPKRRKDRTSSPERGRGGRTWRSALCWKDFHFSMGGWRGTKTRLAIYAVTFASTLWWGRKYFSGRNFWQDVGMLALVVGGAGLFLELIFASANIFGRERRQHTLGTLCTVPLSPARLIWQKVGGYSLALLPSALILLGGWFLSREEVPWNQVGSGRVHLAQARQFHFSTQVIFFSVLIAYLSLRMRRGALVSGLAALLLWNLSLGFLSTHLAFRGFLQSSAGSASRYSYEAFQHFLANILSGLSVFLIVIGVVLALSIPRRLVRCAAED